MNVLSVLFAIVFLLLYPAAGHAEYKLGVQDKLRITVYEAPNLSGEYTVSAEGTLPIPLIGELPAAGFRTSELGGIISARIQEAIGLIKKPNTTVEVTEFRPFYILGDVEKPGDYPYRPGMLVLNAMSIAGGLFRPAEAGLLRFERDAIQGRGDLHVAELKRKELLARRARLQAELEERESISIPQELQLPTGGPLATQLAKEEQALLVARRTGLNEQLQVQKSLIGLFEKEIQTLRLQHESEGKQLTSVKKELGDVSSLSARGLATVPRVLTLERTMAQIEATQYELQNNMLRAQQGIKGAEREIIRLRDERRREVLLGLQETASQLEELTRRNGTTERLLYDAEITGPQAVSELMADEEVSPAYSIVRREAGDLKEVPASETSSVEPGDIIKVRSRSKSRSLQGRSPQGRSENRSVEVGGRRPRAAN